MFYKVLFKVATKYYETAYLSTLIILVLRICKCLTSLILYIVCCVAYKNLPGTRKKREKTKEIKTTLRAMVRRFVW